MTISAQQEKLLEVTTDVSRLEKDIETIKATVKKAELISESLGDTDDRIKVIMKELDDIWLGMDALSMPLK